VGVRTVIYEKAKFENTPYHAEDRCFEWDEEAKLHVSLNGSNEIDSLMGWATELQYEDNGDITAELEIFDAKKQLFDDGMRVGSELAIYVSNLTFAELNEAFSATPTIVGGRIRSVSFLINFGIPKNIKEKCVNE
jgi:hypothetical protein